MRAAAAAVTAAIALTAAAAASADNYGGVPSSYRARMVALIHRTFDRYGVGSFFVCVANRESGFNPRAANWHDSHGGSFGLFQINGVWSPRGYVSRGDRVSMNWVRRMWNPYQNTAVALSLYRRSGTVPWGGHCG